MKHISDTNTPGSSLEIGLPKMSTVTRKEKVVPKTIHLGVPCRTSPLARTDMGLEKSRRRHGLCSSESTVLSFADLDEAPKSLLCGRILALHLVAYWLQVTFFQTLMTRSINVSALRCQVASLSAAIKANVLGSSLVCGPNACTRLANFPCILL